MSIQQYSVNRYSQLWAIGLTFTYYFFTILTGMSTSSGMWCVKIPGKTSEVSQHGSGNKRITWEFINRCYSPFFNSAPRVQ